MSRARLIEHLLRLTAPLPLWLLHALGGLIGGVGVLIPNSARHIARVNVELCFPDWPLARKRELVRRTLRESAKSLTELGALWYRPLPRVLGLVRAVEGEELVQEGIGRGKGLLVIAPHLGAWEALQAWIGQRIASHALYRPPRQAELEGLITRARSRTGTRFWPAKPSGIRALFKALRSGEAVGVLPDQQPAGEGVFAPFFGVPAKTMTLFCKLAARSEATVLIGWAERLPHGEGYHLRWRRVDDGIRDPDPERAAAAMNAAIEAAARELPCQYQWTYRRFSRQPDGHKNLYKRWRSKSGWVVPIT